MGVFGSVSDGVGTLRRNPLIIGLMFVYTVAATAASGLQGVDPLLIYPAMFVLYLVLPFFIGGMIGVVREGLAGRTSVGEFVDAGKSNFLSLLGGGLILGAITFGLYIVISIVVFIVVIFAVGISLGAGSGLEGIGTLTLALVAVLGIVSFLLVMLPWFVLQFFPAAVVVDDLGLVDSFKRSGGLIRRNFLSVVGFDVVAFLIGLVAQIPTAYLVYQLLQEPMIGTTETTFTVFDVLSTTELAVYFGLVIVLGTLVGSITQAYYVAYYDQLSRGTAA